MSERRYRLRNLMDRRRRRQRQLAGASPAFRARLIREIAEITAEIRRETTPGLRRDDGLLDLWRDFPVPMTPAEHTAAARRIVRDWEEQVRP